MSSNLIGKIINNRYRIEEYLDSGGMGVVFRVWDLQGNVPLAMKMMRIDQFEDPDLLKVFKREAAALKQLPHPNIIPFYGLCETKDYICILEKFVDGPDFLENPNLKDFIKTKKNKRLSIDETLIILKSISAALGFAHEHYVIHCDVKPANVMIDRGGSIYLGDFGIARHADSTITTMLSGAGTLPYMAPEQIKLERVSAATDIYSLGVLTYEILTGKRPFLGDEDSTRHVGNDKNERIRFAHLNLQPPDPSSVNPAISRELSTVLLKALEKDPNARFARCWDFFEAVCKAVGCNPNNVPDRIDIPKSNTTETTTQLPPPIPLTKKSNPIYFIIGSVCVVAILLVFIFQKAKPSDLLFSEKSSPTLTMPTSPIISNEVSLVTETATIEPIIYVMPELIVPEAHHITICDLDSYLNPGDLTFVSLGGGRNRIRSGPDTTPSDNFVGIAESGEMMQIIDGPICDRGGYLLWKVIPTYLTDWQDGWTPEIAEPIGEYWLSPVPYWNPCSDSKVSHLKPGDTAYVNAVNDTSNKIRDAAGLGGSTIDHIKPGETISILDGPICESDYIWWKVKNEKGIIGWTAEGIENEFWILPKFN